MRLECRGKRREGTGRGRKGGGKEIGESQRVAMRKARLINLGWSVIPRVSRRKIDHRE